MNNEEKIFSLLEKVYIELQDTKKELKTEIHDVRAELKGEIQDLRTELKGNIENLRTELKGDIENLRTELKEDIFRVECKTDELQIQLNTLTAKTAHNENKIIELSRDLKRVK